VVGLDRCPLGLHALDGSDESGEDSSEAAGGELGRLDEIQRQILEKHRGDERVRVLGEAGGDDGAERVPDHDDRLADHLEETVGVGDVVVEAVPTGSAGGVSAEVEREGEAFVAEAVDDRCPAGAAGGQSVKEDERPAGVVTGDVVGDRRPRSGQDALGHVRDLSDRFSEHCEVL
jgi:hypothetical protein